MARSDAKVRVKLDTGPAEASLKGLSKKAAATAGRVGGTLRGAVGRGLGTIGLGAGVGTGMAAVRGATQSGFGDVLGEAFGGFGARLAEGVFGKFDQNARADKAAREETIRAFGAVTGQTGKIPPGAKRYFDQVQALRLQEETGREMFDRDDRFRSTSVTALVDRIMTGLGEMISKAATDIAAALWPFN